jgi:hypothetical protein
MECGTYWEGKRMKLANHWTAFVHWLVPGVLAFLLIACAFSTTPAPTKEPLDLTILHTGQVYGEIAPCG